MNFGNLTDAFGLRVSYGLNNPQEAGIPVSCALGGSWYSCYQGYSGDGLCSWFSCGDYDCSVRFTCGTYFICGGYHGSAPTFYCLSSFCDLSEPC